jgi:hypothetical protein
MVMLRGRKIRFSHILVHLVGGDFASDTEEDGKSYGRCSYGMVDLVLSMCVTGFVSKYLDLSKSLTAATLAVGRWSLGTCAPRFASYYKQY